MNKIIKNGLNINPQSNVVNIYIKDNQTHEFGWINKGRAFQSAAKAASDKVIVCSVSQWQHYKDQIMLIGCNTPGKIISFVKPDVGVFAVDKTDVNFIK